MIRRGGLLAGWLGTCLLLAAADLAAEPEPTARAWLEAFSAGLDDLHADFSQVIVGPDGAIEDQASGELWLQRPRRLRWEYAGDFPEVIVADGETVWMHDITLEQVTVRPQADFGTGSPFMLLTDLSGLDDTYRVTEGGELDGLRLLLLDAREAGDEFERIVLGLAEDGLRLMILEDSFGLRTELRFSGLRRNPGLDDDLFRFTPPAGVDVVGAPTRDDAGS